MIDHVSVYVDDMKKRYGRMTMCHMIADGRKELFGMARFIGVRLRWVQDRGTWREHFDICMAMRAKAIAAGAIAVSKKELIAKLIERKDKSL